MEFFGWPGVDAILFCEAGASCGEDAVLKEVIVFGSMGVGVDCDFAIMVFDGGAPMNIAEVESFPVCVDFESGIGFGGGFEECVHVGVETFAVDDDSAGRVADDVNIRMSDRFEEAPGGGLAVLAQ